MYAIVYKHCGETWFDAWDCACDSECPICGADITPLFYEDFENLEYPEAILEMVEE